MFLYILPKMCIKKSKGNHITPDSGKALAQRNTEPTTVRLKTILQRIRNSLVMAIVMLKGFFPA
jgi:hypothetical protein